MAVTFSNLAKALTIFASSSTPSVTNCSVTAGSNQIVLGFVVLDTNVVANSATYGGVAMTKIAAAATDTVRIEGFYLINPSNALSTFAVSLASATVGLLGCVAYNGVDTTGTPVGTPQSGTTGGTTNTTVSTAGITTAAGDWTVGCAAVNGNRVPSWVPTTGSGGSTRSEANDSTLVTGCIGDTSAPANPQTDTVTWTTVSLAAIQSIPLHPLAATTSTVVFRRNLSVLGARAGSRQVHSWP